LVAAILLFGCRPFQQPPEEFETYFKPGVGSKGVIEQMVRCGYPNERGFVGRNGVNVSLKTRIHAEQCMLRAGFKSKNGYGGVCSSKEGTQIPVCNE
jgi:hypothetical protein